MNEARRERLRQAAVKLSDAQSIIQIVCDKEEDCMDNCPENLQSTDRYERMEQAVDCLNDALEKLEEVQECVQTAIGQ